MKENFNINQLLFRAITKEFEKYPAIEKAVLFGSRARGDNTERSDYDIAVYGDLERHDRTVLRLTFEEDLPTLHKIDLIFMQDELQPAFRESIEREGIEIYGKAEQ